jgi:hypothetical protein
MLHLSVSCHAKQEPKLIIALGHHIFCNNFLIEEDKL